MIKKRIFQMVGVVTTVLAMNINSFASTIPTEEPSTVDLTILSTTDLHGFFMPWDYASDQEYKKGSLASIATEIKRIRSEEENVLLIDCGDAIQNNYNELFKDSEKNPMVEAMNALDYDVWVMGNHEYNFTPEVLNKWLSQFKGQALSGVVYNKDGTRYLPATTIVEVGGVKVGIVGLTTPLIQQFEKSSGTLATYDIHDGISETQKALDELSGKVDIVIGALHMGVEDQDGIGTGVESILNAFPNSFDAIFCGHLHKTISTEINGIPIIEAGRWGSDLGRMDFTLTRDGDGWSISEVVGENIPIAKVEPDAELMTMLTPYHEQLRQWVSDPIGQVEGEANLVAPDDIQGIATVQTEPTPYFNLLHDVAQHYSGAMVVGFYTDNDAASMSGDIKIRDIAYNYTYPGGEITVYAMKGQDLKDYMEWSADYFNQMKAGDITLSYDPVRRGTYSTNTIYGGINYKIDVTKELGSRVVELTWPDGRPVDMSEEITLGIHSYPMEKQQAIGGQMEGRDFEVIYDSLDEYGDAGTLRNLTISYIQDVLGGKVVPDTSKNFEIIGMDKDSESYKLAKELINSGKLSLHNDGDDTNIRSITEEDLEVFR